MALKAGDRVTVVEHDEATKTPRDGGKRFPATVVSAEGIYVQVDYDDRTVHRGRPDPFYASSLWRAWDGRMRWRLMTPDAEEA